LLPPLDISLLTTQRLGNTDVQDAFQHSQGYPPHRWPGYLQATRFVTTCW